MDNSMIENAFVASLLIFVATAYIIWTKIHDISEKLQFFGGMLLFFSSIGMFISTLMWIYCAPCSLIQLLCSCGWSIKNSTRAGSQRWML